MTAWEQTGSMGAAARDEANSKSAAKSDGAEEWKSSTKFRKGKKAKGKLAVKSNGAGKHKTHGLAVMSIAQKEAMFESAIVNMVEVVKSNECAVISLSEELPREEALALFVYQNYFWMKNRNAVYDKLSGEAVLRVAADNWKSFNDSDKAPYVAKARASEILVAELEEYKKTRKLTQAMMNLKM